MAAAAILEKIQMAISPQLVVRSTACLVLEWGFRDGGSNAAISGSKKSQDGGRRHLGKISNGHISATGRPIHSMFGSRVGFSGTADLMALFLVRKKSKMAAGAILEKIQMAISPQLVVRSTACFVLEWGFRGRQI